MTYLYYFIINVSLQNDALNAGLHSGVQWSCVCKGAFYKENCLLESTGFRMCSTVYTFCEDVCYLTFKLFTLQGEIPLRA